MQNASVGRSLPPSSPTSHSHSPVQGSPGPGLSMDSLGTSQHFIPVAVPGGQGLATPCLNALLDVWVLPQDPS